MAIVGEVVVGKSHRDALISMGFQVGADNTLVVTHQDLKQLLTHNFTLGTSGTSALATGWAGQTTTGLTFRHVNTWELEQLVQAYALSAYQTRSQGQDFGVTQYAQTQANLFELYSQSLRTYGVTKSGLSGSLDLRMSPALNAQLRAGVVAQSAQSFIAGATQVRPSVGMSFNYQLDPKNMLAGGADWNQFGSNAALKWTHAISALTALSLEGYTSKPQVGQMMHGVKLTVNIAGDFDGMGIRTSTRTPGASPAAAGNAPGQRQSLLTTTSASPFYRALGVEVAVDATVKPVLLVSVDKAGLPAGASIDSLNGNISFAAPAQLGTFVSAVNTSNGAVVPGSIFALSGGTVTLQSRAVEPFLTPGTQTIAATFTGGVLNIVVQKGSVKILSITFVQNIPAPDAPTGLALNTAAVTNNNRPTLSWGAVANATSYSVRINGGGWVDVGNTTSYQLPVQSDGLKTLQVQANKLAGGATLVSPASASVSVTIDTVLPGVPTALTLNTPAITNDTRPTLSWGAVASATSYSVRINGGAWFDVGNTTSYQLPAQTDGLKSLQVQANRLVGTALLVSAPSASISVTIDTAATGAPAGLAISTTSVTTDNRPILSWGAMAGATSYSVRINGGAWVDVGNTTSYQLPAQTDGLKTLQVQANKLVGVATLISAASTAVNVTIDTAATGAPAGLAISTTSVTTDNRPILFWGAVASATSYSVRINGGAWVDVGSTTSYQLPAQTDGLKTLQVQANKVVGTATLVSAASTAVSVTIDTAPPTVPTGVTLNTPSVTDNSRPTLSWGAVAGATSYSVRINGGAWVDVGSTTSYQLPAQTDGLKTLQVQANKLVGTALLVSPASTSVGVTIDTFVPPPVVVAPGTPTGLALNTPAVTNNNRPTLSWAAVAGATSYSVRINAGAWVDVGNSTSYQLPTQTDGLKTLQVQANKLVGGSTTVSAASAGVGVTVDTVAPALNSVSLTNWSGNFGTAGTAVFTMSEPLASITSVVMKFVTGPNIGAVVPGINLVSTINVNQVTVMPGAASGSATTLGVRIEISGVDAAGNTFTVTTVGFGIA